jgi:SOS response regulatory protein OraA/RecX
MNSGRGRSRAGTKRGRGGEDVSAEGAVVSEIRAEAGKPGCVAVRVRGHKPWRIDDTEVGELGLAKGVVLDAPLLARLEQASANCKAKLKLRSRLATRPLSRMEASMLMRRAGADAQFIKGVVERFEELGWIDDAKLAERVASSEAARPVGKMRVVARVSRRGINSSEARRAADTAVAARKESPLRLAEIAANGQLRKLPPALDVEARRRRILGFLARRGFDEHTAREAVVRLLGRGERQRGR